MTIVRHELRQGRTAFLIWTVSIAFLMAICVFLYPELEGQMDEWKDVFADLGAFSSAFGMDRLNFGSLTGFYAVECGNVLGIGGALFSALTAANMLSKEEKDGTAEFLLSHPLSRTGAVTGKLTALLIEIILMNLIIYAVSLLSIAAIGEEIPWKEISLIHLAYALMQIETAGICFGISAFMIQGSIGCGIGIAVLMYFLNIIANIAEAAKPLKYITPFSYCEAADIVESGRLDTAYLLIGILLCMLGIGAAYFRYTKKDIR